MAGNVVVRVEDYGYIRGQDGYSPVVTIEEIEHGHSVNITDREHPEGQSFDVLDGVTYTPSVDAAGNISWTNDGDLPNPQTRNIKGPTGDKLTYADLTAADKADLVQGPIAEAQTAAVAAVNQTGTTQVSAVNTAGATQVQAVEDKGEEVLESIPEDYTELTEDVADLKNDVLDLQYKEIAISSFTANPREVEKGSTVTEVVLSYTLNKTPATLKLDGVDLTPASSGTETKTGLSLTENHSWTLAATDTGSPSHAAASDSETATLSFLNKAYWGVDTIPDTLNSAFVLGLANSVLTGTKARTITVNATSGKHIWYAVPTSFGTCSFKIGGFDGGFEAPTTISLTNASGHTENYYVYRSTNPSLGNTTVAIS